MGVANIKVTEKNGKVAGIQFVGADEQVLLITEQGKIIRVDCSGIRSVGRSTQGVRLIHVEEGDRVVSAVKIVRDDEVAGAADEPLLAEGELETEESGEGTDEPVH
jgi:DNA gyrase subunit A